MRTPSDRSRTYLLLALTSVGLILGIHAAVRADAPTGRYTASGGTVFDTKTRLTWQQASTSADKTWADAKTYCAGVGATLGGTGWRLPTVKELITLVDFSRKSQAIDQTYFPMTTASYFWTTTPLAGSPSSAWTIWGFDGSATPFSSSQYFAVRCVR